MDINRVVYFGQTLIDLTADTVQPSSLFSGVTAHAATGATIIGTYQPPVSMTTSQIHSAVLSGWGASASTNSLLYNGSYAFTPSFSTVHVSTTNKLLTEDINISAISVQSSLNSGGGNTIYVGGVVSAG